MTFQVLTAIANSGMAKHPSPIQEGDSPLHKKNCNTIFIDNDKVFKNRVSFCFLVQHAPNIQNKIAALFARLQQVDPQLVIFPFNDSSEALPILSGPKIPTIPDEFHQYFFTLCLTCQQVEIFTTVQSSQQISSIKFSLFIINYMKTHNIFMSTHTIKLTNIIPVGWFLNVNLAFHSIGHVRATVHDLLPDHLHEALQLKNCSINYAGDHTVYTQSWVLEMDKVKAESSLEIIFNTLSPHSPLTLVWMDSCGDTSGDIRKSFQEQNKFLNNHIVIKVDNFLGWMKN